MNGTTSDVLRKYSGAASNKAESRYRRGFRTGLM